MDSIGCNERGKRVDRGSKAKRAAGGVSPWHSLCFLPSTLPREEMNNRAKSGAATFCLAIRVCCGCRKPKLRE